MKAYFVNEDGKLCEGSSAAYSVNQSFLYTSSMNSIFPSTDERNISVIDDWLDYRIDDNELKERIV
jgi:hypothetical protein